MVLTRGSASGALSDYLIGQAGQRTVIGDNQDAGLVARGADLSSCGRYRYVLHREWAPRTARMLFIMLNPSTADALVDDPTIRRCMGFARREKYGGIDVVNLYAWRATDPRELAEAFDPQGPDNDRYLDDRIREQAQSDALIICAWGAHPIATEVGDALITRYKLEGVDFHCLGKTKDGHPKHPLYVPANELIVGYP